MYYEEVNAMHRDDPDRFNPVMQLFVSTRLVYLRFT